MILDDLHSAIKSSRVLFDQWLTENLEELSEFFYGSTGAQLINFGFELYAIKEILQSQVYREYHQKNLLTPPFEKFLGLVGIAAEKMAENGRDHLAKMIVTDLPNSATKYRIKALNEFCQVEDVRSDFFKRFPTILSYLDKSRVGFEEGSVRPIVDVLSFFFQRSTRRLEEVQYRYGKERIISLFQDPKLNHNFPFLGHEILHDLIEGQNPFDLYVEPVASECLYPSPVIRHLFQTFNKEYFDHPSIDHRNDQLWGHKVKYILDNILVRGRGDFTSATGRISAEDKVMLYCFFNLKKHFFSSYAVFNNVIKSLGYFFTRLDYRPVVIDLGCGPMTSGLALADLIHTKTGQGIIMSYVGIDISVPMMDKAKTFTALEIFSPQSSFEFYRNWNDLKFLRLGDLAGKNNPIFFNASYLFASESLDYWDLANYTQKVANSYSNVYLIFQNPNREDRNWKYRKFKELLKYTLQLHQVENVRYKAATDEKSEDVEYEIIRLLND